MTPTTLRLKTRVLPGKRIEFTSPELDEGEDVELIVLRAETASESETRTTMLDFIKTTLPGPRPFATWEEYEQALREEKEEWNH